MTVTHEDAVATLHAMFPHVEPKAISKLLVEMGTTTQQHQQHHVLTVCEWIGGHMENTVERLLRVPKPGHGTRATLPPSAGPTPVPVTAVPVAQPSRQQAAPASPDRGGFRLPDDFLRPPSYHRAMANAGAAPGVSVSAGGGGSSGGGGGGAPVSEEQARQIDYDAQVNKHRPSFVLACG